MSLAPEILAERMRDLFIDEYSDEITELSIELAKEAGVSKEVWDLDESEEMRSEYWGKAYDLIVESL